MNTQFLNTFRWAICGIGLFAASTVWADFVSNGGWYLEATTSGARSSKKETSLEIDDEKFGWALGFGYAFNKYLSVQANYHDLGRNHYASDCPGPNLCLVRNVDEVDIEGVSLSAVASWPLTDTFDVFGKLGVIRWNTNFSKFDRDESGEDLLYGVGVGVHLTPNWRATLQYERFNFDVETASLGLNYRF